MAANGTAPYYILKIYNQINRYNSVVNFKSIPTVGSKSSNTLIPDLMVLLCVTSIDRTGVQTAEQSPIR